jgi:cytochrome oxidase Cu insertion factor (SCO1/SenC/PrrC family)
MFGRDTLRRTGGAAALLLVLAPLGAADKAPEEKTGVKVGAKAPAFTLKDQAGKERTLDEFLKKGKVALVFYRSAGW